MTQAYLCLHAFQAQPARKKESSFRMWAKFQFSFPPSSYFHLFFLPPKISCPLFCGEKQNSFHPCFEICVILCRKRVEWRGLKTSQRSAQKLSLLYFLLMNSSPRDFPRKVARPEIGKTSSVWISDSLSPPLPREFSRHASPRNNRRVVFYSPKEFRFLVEMLNVKSTKLLLKCSTFQISQKTHIF